MQASDRVLASRYGRALFAAAAAKGEEARVQSDLAGARGVLHDLTPVLRNPRVSTADKKKRLGAELGKKVAATTLKFLELLIDKKRFELLPAVIGDLGRLVNEKNNLAKALVRTARPLPAEAQQKLKDRLKAFSGRNIELEIKEDPDLLGGLVVRLGDWVLDSSFRGQLRTLRETINGH